LPQKILRKRLGIYFRLERSLLEIEWGASFKARRAPKENNMSKNARVSKMAVVVFASLCLIAVKQTVFAGRASVSTPAYNIIVKTFDDATPPNPVGNVSVACGDPWTGYLDFTDAAGQVTFLDLNAQPSKGFPVSCEAQLGTWVSDVQNKYLTYGNILEFDFTIPQIVALTQ
jgi:hypothetical protein